MSLASFMRREFSGLLQGLTRRWSARTDDRLSGESPTARGQDGPVALAAEQGARFRDTLVWNGQTPETAPAQGAAPTAPSVVKVPRTASKAAAKRLVAARSIDALVHAGHGASARRDYVALERLRTQVAGRIGTAREAARALPLLANWRPEDLAQTARRLCGQGLRAEGVAYFERAIANCNTDVAIQAVEALLPERGQFADLRRQLNQRMLRVMVA